MATLQLADVSMQYPSGAGVRNMNLTIDHGELVTLLGPSGCGKTTLLRLIGGFIEPTCGHILIDGQDVISLPPEKRPTAMVFQQYNLWPHMTVYDNLAFGLKLRKLPKNEIHEAIHDMLELIQLPGVANRRPGELSGGQQQRIALGRALLLKPKVLLLDEPFSNLDAKLRIELREEVKRIQRETEITTIFVTHDQEEALYLSDRVVVMNQGNVEQVSTPSELYDYPQTLFVARFIGEMNCLPVTSDNLWIQIPQAQQALKRFPSVLAVRPEHVQLSQELSPIFGRIKHKTISGHYTKMEIDTNIGALIAYQSREGGECWPVGDNLIYIKFSHFQVFHESL